MTPDILDVVLGITESGKLVELAESGRVSLQTIQELKEYSATFYLSDPAMALKVSERAYTLSCSLPPPAPALGAWTLGNAYVYASRYAEASRCYAEAREQYFAAGLPLEAARMSVGHVGVLAYLGELEAGLQLASEIGPLLQASSAAEKADSADLRRLVSLSMNAGVIHELLGDYEDALAVYDDALRLLEERSLAQETAPGQSTAEFTARLLQNRAYLLGQMGDWQQALDAYACSERLFHDTGSTAELVRLHINRSALFIHSHRFAEAALDQEGALRLLSDLPSSDQVAHRLTLLRAQLALAARRPITDNLLGDLVIAQRAFAEQGPLLEEGLAWLLLGECHMCRGSRSDARICYMQVHGISERGADRSLQHRALQGLARVAEGDGEHELALSLYARAIDVVDLSRHGLQIEYFRATFLSDKLDVYRACVALLLRLGREVEAFHVVERSKSRLIADKLSVRLTREIEQAVASSDAETKGLARRLQLAFEQLGTAYRKASAARRQDDVRGTDAEGGEAVAALENRVQELLLELQRRYATFSNLALGQPLSLDSLRQILSERVFLQYHTVEGQICAFVIDQTTLLAHVVLVPEEDVARAQGEFRAATEQLLTMLGHGRRDRILRHLPLLLEQVNASLQSLYTYLVQPLQHFFKADTSLVIAPDGILHALPFHALFDGEHYLVEQHTVSYAPSATVLDCCMRQQVNDRGAVLVGFDDHRLTAVAEELEAIAQFFPDAVTLLGDEATTQAFLEQAQRCAHAHIAAHAAFRTDKPMMSAIVLADRRLTLAEISTLQLQAELVTLSGCETGFGRLQGADLLSLASGFLGAGARSLMVSLWRVDDQATADLMRLFYASAQRSSSYAEALREAQRALLAMGREADDMRKLYQHPVSWAPFVLVGSWGKL